MEQARRHKPAEGRPVSSEYLRSRSNLTSNQIGFWLGQRISPASSIYNMGQLFRLQFEVDTTCFRAAFAALVKRSDALRTRFSEIDGVPRQTVVNELDYTVPVVDFSGREDADARLDEWCAERIALPIDLEKVCFDTALVRLGPEDWAWYFCLHHLIGDGTSVDLIFHRVERFYAAAVRGQLEDEPDLPRFSTYVLKEREYRESEACRIDARFWEERLSSTCESVSFYGNHRVDTDDRCLRAAVDLGRARSNKLLSVTQGILGAGLSADLNALSAYLAVLAAYQARTSGQARLVAGVPFHNRPSRHDKEVIGLMMEVVPLTLEVKPDDAFVDLLARARSEILRVLRHYRYGATNAARSKTYDVMLNLLPSSTTEFAGAPVSANWIHSGRWNEALTLQVQKSGNGDRLYFDMNRKLFCGDLARRAPQHFVNMLESLVRAPDEPVSRADILGAGEIELLGRWLFTPGRAAATQETVVSHFEAAVARSPDAPAVIDGDRVTSYRALNAKANQLAAYMRRRGVGDGDHVGICMRRSVERIVGIIAILKAGGAYVPIDESWPADRIRQMLSDANVRTIVTEAENAAVLGAEASWTYICVDEEAELIGKEPDASPVLATDASDCACIFFTSGSTGRPKGVMILHAGIVRLVVGADYADFNPETVMLQMASISFDAATFEIWGALLGGGKLVLLPESLPTASSIRRQIRTAGVNTLLATTSLFNLLIDEDPECFDGILQLLTGGEAASPRHLASAKAALPGARVVNAYGPTESTVIATCFEVPDSLPLDEPVPIGRPIAATCARVLDPLMRDVPIGGVGELYIGGAGVAAGYVGQPELTTDRFVRLPPDTATPWYKTGDMVRVRDDGNLVFVGRIDNQVKVHGFRIELDEVELALNSLPQVSRAVVILQKDRDGAAGLAAYVVASGPEPSPEAFRSALRKKLPAMMIPRWIVFLPELPLNASGKIDRQQLPAPDQSVTARDNPKSLPTSGIERQLAGIWQELLNVPTTVVGIDDNFFELGGDSIIAIQFAARVSRLGLAFSAEDVFEYPTIRLLSERAVSRRQAQGTVTAIEGEVSLSPIQHWFFEQEFESRNHWNMAIVLDAAGPVDIDAARRALDAVLDQHEALRARFRRSDGRWSQVITTEKNAGRFSALDVQGASGKELDEMLAAAARTAHAGLDIETGDVTRMLLLNNIASGRSQVLWVIHHLVTDGVSWRILLEDFDQAYRQAHAGVEISLPGRTSSLRDFAVARADYQASSAFQQHDSYRRDVDALPRIPLPVDHPDGSSLAGTTDSNWQSLGVDETCALITAAPKKFGAPVHHVLVAALARTVCAWACRDSLMIDLEGHGRERIAEGVDLSRTVGWFTSMYPVLLDSGSGGIVEYLKQASDAINKVPARGIGYGVGRYLSGSYNAEERIPDPPMSFNYLGQFDHLLSGESPFRVTDLFSSDSPLVSGSIAPINHRPHELDVVAQVSNGALQVGWYYSRERYSSRTISTLNRQYMEELRRIVCEAEKAEPPESDPVRFEQAGLNREQYNDVLAELGIGSGSL